MDYFQSSTVVIIYEGQRRYAVCLLALYYRRVQDFQIPLFDLSLTFLLKEADNGLIF